MTADHIGTLALDGSAHVWIKRKASAAICMQKGEYTANPLLLPEAIEILHHRKTLAEKEGVTDLFPHWKAQDASRVVKRAAQLHEWPDNVIWNGAHNARHGAARDTFDAALTQVMATGMWDSRESAERYGAPRGALQQLARFHAKRLPPAKGPRGPDPSQGALARQVNARNTAQAGAPDPAGPGPAVGDAPLWRCQGSRGCHYRFPTPRRRRYP